jgi:hypothetical protein
MTDEIILPTDKPKYYLDEGVEREGDIPEWFKAGKYKTVAEQAKAYVDLEKKLGNFTGAPDNYMLPEGVSDSDPLVNFLKEQGKAQNLSQEGFSGMIESFKNLQTKSREEFKNQLNSLPPSEKQRVQGVFNFIKNHFSKEELPRVEAMIRSLDDVNMFDKLRRVTSAGGLQKEQSLSPQPSYTTLEEYKQYLRDNDMWKKAESDPNLKREIENKFMELTGR